MNKSGTGATGQNRRAERKWQRRQPDDVISNWSEAQILVQGEYGSVPVQDPCALRYGVQAGAHQLTYIGQRPTGSI